MAQTTAEPMWGIWGNQAAVDRLRRAVRIGPSHAYVVTGPPSIGKSLIATAFASALICPNAIKAGSGCGMCSTCRRVARGIHPDVLKFDLAHQAANDEGRSRNSTLNIATIRDITRHVWLRPLEATWRVVIVDDVETMQETAQEAFLKTLEEPPSYAVILLLTTDAELLLPTVLSRCSRVSMTTASNAEVEQALEAGGAEADDARILAMASRGRVGLALNALADNDIRTGLVESVSKASAWIGAGEYARVVESIRLADRFSESRDLVFEQLLSAEVAWRELARDHAGTGESSTHPVVSSYRLSSLQDGLRALVAIDRCLKDLDANVRPRSALESMVLSWPTVLPSTAR